MKISTPIISAVLALVLAGGSAAGTLGIGADHDAARAEVTGANNALQHEVVEATTALTELDEATYAASSAWTEGAGRVLDDQVRTSLALALDDALTVRGSIAETVASGAEGEAEPSVWPWETKQELARVQLLIDNVELLDDQATDAVGSLGTAIAAVEVAVAAWEAEQARIAAEAVAAAEAEAQRVTAQQAATAEANARAAAEAEASTARDAAPAPTRPVPAPSPRNETAEQRVARIAAGLPFTPVYRFGTCDVSPVACYRAGDAIIINPAAINAEARDCRVAYTLAHEHRHRHQWESGMYVTAGNEITNVPELERDAQNWGYQYGCRP